MCDHVKVKGTATTHAWPQVCLKNWPLGISLYKDEINGVPAGSLIRYNAAVLWSRILFRVGRKEFAFVSINMIEIEATMYHNLWSRVCLDERRKYVEQGLSMINTRTYKYTLIIAKVGNPEADYYYDYSALPRYAWTCYVRPNQLYFKAKQV
ncbi:hypothetical protein SLEP1_g36585 [Rubroshorea leprosula]|uniref:Uncharacterized protein n=1 Tax=Rubroshorea leprosula TaxID=152421 RepID=A0AAV5KSG0_9ROSI|nr:hypothetical protein SLEP1_g36585 [Rubroshorea leprosula]